jgi:poly [ADP-ribose] polymerase
LEFGGEATSAVECFMEKFEDKTVRGEYVEIKLSYENEGEG